MFSINMERVLKRPNPVIEELLINSCSARVLFDVEATHSFISKDFVSKNKISYQGIRRPIRVSSTEGKRPANAVCQSMTLEFETHKFPSELFVLDSQGFDIIIGKDWMSKSESQIDCVSRAVTLTTPERKRIRYQFKSRSKETN